MLRLAVVALIGWYGTQIFFGIVLIGMGWRERSTPP